MREIPLAKGRGVAVVDEADYDRLSAFRWRLHTVYRLAMSRDVNGQTVYMHRLVLQTNARRVLHRNGDGLDNRRENLVVADRPRQRKVHQVGVPTRAGVRSRPTFVGRFIARIEPEPNSGCWLWTGCQSGDDGYGMTRVPGIERPQKAHRVAYALFIGRIADGLFVCHRCDTPLCVNPDHLFLGTAKDNAQDMINKGRQFDQRRTHCFKGHELTPGNTYLYDDAKRRITRRACRTCMKAAHRRWTERNPTYARDKWRERHWTSSRALAAQG